MFAMTRNAMLAKVHIARQQLDMPQEEYRALLERVTGRSSAADLDDAALDRVLGEFKALGWKPTTNPAAGKRISAKPHVRKIFALWGELARAHRLKEGSRAALVAFVERQTGVAHPDWLTATQANSVTEALKAMQQRRRG